MLTSFALLVLRIAVEVGKSNSVLDCLVCLFTFSRLRFYLALTISWRLVILVLCLHSGPVIKIRINA